MNLFNGNFTLRSKLIAAIMVCCIVALFLNNLFVLSVETLDFKKNKENRLLILANVLANNSTAALNFLDNETAKEILNSASADKSIHHAVLLDRNCQIFAEYNMLQLHGVKKIKLDQNSCNFKPQFTYTNQYLCLSLPVVFDQEQIGFLYIKSSLNDWNEKLDGQIKIFSLLFFVTLVISFLLSYKVQMIFLNPIKRLLLVIRHITEHRDYSVKVSINTNDELSVLAEELNRMVETINQHDLLLNDQNQLLEKTVAQRTRELQLNLHKFEQAKEKAEHADHAKSDFLAHISHDLRTPLNGLLGYIQLLQRDPDFPHKFSNEINIISQSGHYLLSLINDLLDLTKIETNKLVLFQQPFYTHSLIDPIIELFSKQMEGSEIQFLTDVENDLPDSLYGDENRLRRILTNLLDNAFKFTSEGMVKFSIRYKSNTMIFTVEDTGCGIDEKNIQAIYKPFNQFSRFTNNDGIGLGLFITKYLVDLMGGTLLINSQLNKGTQCMLTIPLSSGQPNNMTAENNRHIIGYHNNLQTVLIVDDKKHNRDVLVAMLKPLEFNLICVDSGIACLDCLKSMTVDIVLLDMVMPVLDGLDTCLRIKKMNLAKQPKIVMVTANAFADDRERSFKVGCDDFIAKPIMLDKLLEILQIQLDLKWKYQENQPPEQVKIESTPIEYNVIRVLIAEDDEIGRILLQRLMEELNVDAVFAKDGKQALDIALNSVFDCIVLDIRMPYKSGFEVADYIRNHENKNRNTYLVAMSALVDETLKIKVANLGFDEVLSKPIDIEVLKKLFETSVNKRA